MSKTQKGKFSERVKGALGIEGDTKTVVFPMLSYTATNIATSGAGYINGLYYIAFLTYVEGLSGSQIGLIMLLKSIWDAITDPMMGIITDRTRSRFGKHRVYIIFAAVPFAITFFMTWYSFGISGMGNSNLTMMYYIFAYFLYSTVTTVLSVPHTAMLPEMAPDYFLRTQYNSVGYLMNSTGMVPSFLIASIPFGLFQTKTFDETFRMKFVILGICLSLFYIIPIIITGIKCKEPSSLQAHFEPFDGKYVFKEYIQVFRNRAFRQYFTISLLYMFALGFYNNTKVYFMKELADVWVLYNVTNVISGIFEASGFPLNYWLTKKFGKQRSSWITTPFYIISLVIILFINGNKKLGAIPITNIAVLVHCAFYNFGLSGIGFTTSNIYPDVTDVDEMITGRRREGVVATFSTFIKKIASGFLGMIVLTSLEWFGVAVSSKTTSVGVIAPGHYASDLFGKFFDYAFGIKLTGAVIPIICIAGALLALRNYTMTKNDHSMIRAAIATKKIYGDVTLTEEEKKTCEKIAGQKWENMWISKAGNGEYHPLEKDEKGKYIVPELTSEKTEGEKAAV